MDSDTLNDSDDSEYSVEETAPNKVKNKRKYEDIPTDAPKTKKKSKNELYKPPTVEELNNLRETENLFNNNLFRLQIDELLTEIKIKTKRESALSKWLENFKQCIKKLPTKEIALLNLSNSKDKLYKYLTEQEKLFKTDQDVLLKFTKPEEIQSFGLSDNNCAPGPHLHHRINLTMPSSCFLSKDYSNNRYLVKRYYYLLFVSYYLKQSDLVANLKISRYENNHLLPVIELTPKGTDKTTVFILVTPVEGSFKPTRFLPEQNNCKTDLFDSDIDANVLKNTPTIFYNSLLAHDTTLYINNQFLKSLLEGQKNIQDGVKLLTVWLRQRELNVGVGSFTETILIHLIAYLTHKKKINKFMSSYQIIRNFWNFITTVDLSKEPIALGETSEESMKAFKQSYDIVVLDKTGCYNVASFLSADLYEKIKTESRLALKHLDDNRNNSFNNLFLTKRPFHLQYDAIIDLTESLPLEIDHDVKSQQKCSYIGYKDLLIYKHISDTLKRGLDKRIVHIVPRIEAKEGTATRLLFGLNLNPDEAFSFLQKGPALSDFERASEFRKFWGPLASDRRFKDGSTNVAVYFKTNTIKAKRGIVAKVLRYLLVDKLGLRCRIHYDQFEEFLLCKRLVPSYPSGTNEETCLKIVLASNELGKKLRELSVSLKITGVQGVSDAFAYSEIHPPIPSNFQISSFTSIKGNNFVMKCDADGVPRYVQPVESVLQLEHSSKWPNDLSAVRHLKTSFYLEISKQLETDGLLTHPSRDYLDVFYQGIVFRYKLFVPKEIGLSKRIETDEGLTSFKDSDESDDLELSLNILPKITGALRGIQSMYPSYGPGTCLIKRWLRSHLIDEYHVSDITIDLLNASLYLDENTASNTPQMSFLRFLKFASELDWNLQIVLVNFNGDLTAEEIAKVESEVQNNRNSYPNLFVLTPYDRYSSAFTRRRPSKEILSRIKRLAAESLDYFEKMLAGNSSIGIKELFLPNFEGYNVLIHLKPSMVPRRFERISYGTVDRKVVDKYKLSKDDRIPIVDFDPVRDYLEALRKYYGKYAVFFYDRYGGCTIGVLWDPKTLETTDFKVNKINGGKVIDGRIIAFNEDAVIEDFYVIGKDLVKSIEKRTVCK
ncbi:unnamed protein product [Phyllotreta striolata]|uniref:Nucleolar protein 6 n=1 Tax=Phyllotreta striolata TaxID=444603 RepID=A0A9N9TKR6_PHYSR|nr:unnamed protein product [Phyllotreta striolata]